MSPNDLRRAFASWMLQAGETNFAVARSAFDVSDSPWLRSQLRQLYPLQEERQIKLL